MRHTGKQLFALLLAAVMTLSLLPSAALARGADADETPVREIPLGDEAAELFELPEDPVSAEPAAAGDIAVTVADEDITLIAAKVSWAEAPNVSAYTVTVTSAAHSGLGTDNVWYQDDAARTAKLANLHPGTTYTVTVTGGGAAGSATFTTKTSTNAKAEDAKRDAEAPAPYGALPDDQQLYYHENDMAAFIHFGPNTFTNREWGTGYESPSDFNLAPGELTDDPFYETRGTGQIPLYVDQWVKELQDAGFQRLIMVAKHHDGFCLWDSEYTDHDVMASPYGRDLLADVSSACTRYNMDMGFYFSPWDRHEKSFGYWKRDCPITERTADDIAATRAEDVTEDYNIYYQNQLHEVLGNPIYGNDGEFVETWMDGAKGVFVDPTTKEEVGGKTVNQEYDFDTWFKIIRELQPKCLIYTDRADGGVRWSGNEVGSTGSNPEGTGAGDMCWQTMDVATFNYEGTDTPGMMDPWKPGGNITKWYRQRGKEGGVIWSVCECDVSIETGWFGKDGNGLRELDTLIDMYLTSVGYGSPFLLNLPPVKTGYFRDNTSARLAALGKAVRDTFRTDMLREEGYTVTAAADKTRTSATAGKFGAANLIDGDPDTYWTMNDNETTGSVTISLGATRTFDIVTLKEYIPLGQRIKAGKVEYHDETGWHDFSTFTTVGAKRIIRTEPVKGDQIRVTISGSNAVPLLSAVEVYKARSGMELGSGIPDGLTYIDDQEENAIEYSASGWQTKTNDSESINRTKTYVETNTSGNPSFTYTFDGSKIYVMGIKDPGNGSFRVRIDDGAWTEVSTVSTSRQTKAILWSSDNLTEGEHTIEVERVSGWFDFDGLYTLPAGKSIVEFEEAAYDVLPDSTLELKLVRAGSTTNAVTVKVNDLPGTAVQGQHYEPVARTVTLEAGETEKTITVTVLNGTEGNRAIGKDFAMGLSEPGENVTIGFNKEAAINIVDPESIPQIPVAEGEDPTYTTEDPFRLPTKKGVTRRLEGEHMILDASQATDSTKYVRLVTDTNASNGKKVGWFEPGNKIVLPYNATQVGIYTMTLRYQSGRSTSDTNNWNKMNWTGANVVDRSEKIPGLGGNGNDYGEHSYQFVVTTAGPGTVEFTADASACPNIDYIDFRLIAIGPLAESVAVTPATTELFLNSAGEDTAQLTAAMTPTDAANPVTWTSSDANVATVNSAGRVTAVGNGTATITATVGEASYQRSATATVTVKTKLSESVTLSTPARVGAALTATVAPAGATATYQWLIKGSEDAEFSAIAGAGNGNTYTPAAGDEGKTIKVVATGTGNYTGTAEATTAAVLGPAHTVTFTLDGAELSDVSGGEVNGSVVTVDNSGTLTFKLTVANAAKEVKSVTVGGTALTADARGVYTISGITEDKTVTVTVGDKPVPVSTAALEAAITAAGEAAEGVEVIEGKTEAEVEQGTRFVGGAEIMALESAINAAQAVLDKTGVTQAEVDKAVADLNAAKTTFTQAIKTGTKETTTAPVTPPGSSSGNGGSSTTRPAQNTGTQEKEDGTKVTTVTKPDGTKVETTESPDGTKAVVETKKDGSKTQTVEQPDGAKSEMNVTKEGDVTITVTDAEGEELVKTEIPAEIPEPETKFEDVAETAPWAEEAINKVAGLELVKGTGEAKYSPVAPMTRGSLATVLHRLSQGKTDYANTFKDVAQGKFYTEGVAWAAKANVVKGVSEDIFAPEKTITREQLAVMLARYAKLVGLNTKVDGKALEHFADGEKTGTWAVDGVAWCVENGILKGKSGNALDPTADVTRAEVAVMLDRFISLLK